MQKLLSVPFYRRLLLLAVLLHFSAAWFSEGFYHTDEHYEILEFTALKTDGIPEKFSRHTVGNLPPRDTPAGITVWEYLDEIRFDYQPSMGVVFRPAVQPFIAYLFWQVAPEGINRPFITAFLTRLLSVMLAFVAALAFFLAYQNDIKSEAARRWVLAAMLLCWVLLFYHARFSADGWVVSFLFLALAFLRFERFFAAGLLFGLAFAVRYQAGFFLLPLAVYVLFIMRPNLRHIGLLLAGGCGVLVAGFFIDWWFYEKPILPWVNYFIFIVTANTELGETEPALMYWRKGGEFMPPIGYVLPFILAVFWWKFPRHVLTWATVLYVAFHLYTDFKQPRYMFPILALMPLMTALVWEKSIQQREKLNRAFLWLLKISAVVNAPLMLFIAFYPAAVEVKLLRQCVLPYMEKSGLPAYSLPGREEVPFYFLGLSTIRIQDLADLAELAERLQSGEAVLFFSQHPREKQLQENGLEYERVCSALPDWLLRLNFNNWAERASSYPVYRVSKPL